MPVPNRTAGAALRRGRSPARNWCRLILAVALIATTLTAFLTRTIPHLPFFVASIPTPSSSFAATNSTRRDSIIFPLDARNSALIANLETRIDANKKMSDSTRSETHVKKVISGGSDLPISSRREKHRKMAKPHTGDRKVPFWALPPEEALLFAKREIENAPLVADDPDLYAPVFRNLSVFKRSYELMEKVLKVYIYPDGPRPIFHTPQLQVHAN
ncbi:probable glycosyltransferase At5g03795 [Phalaenopsis equestris]|uniref:probable glycosyltransferase At5g03795 n=1 Tax=Phalaenopsis equestris TaxID=78828 RepID=UPI0009E2A898|nr:probable glycosyltransferase At5g03795 [Phalaenopsis equestris]